MGLRPLFRKAKSEVVLAGRPVALGVLGVVAAAACVYAWADYLAPAVADHPYFKLQKVRVASDQRLGDLRGLMSEAKLFRGTSVWRIDTDQARRELERPSWVERADVHLRLPDGVSIRIYKRTPVAATIVGGRAYAVDGSGVVFRDHDPNAYPDLPYLVGWQLRTTQAERMATLRRMVEVLAAAKEYSLRVSEVEADAEGLVHLFPEAPRVAVTIGTEVALPIAFHRLHLVLDNLAAGLADVGEVDVSYRDRVVVRSLPGRWKQLMTVRAESPRELSTDAVAAADRRWGNRG